MRNFKCFDDFTNLYNLSKTLRFELRPVGKTLENINSNGLLTNDEDRAEAYKKAKKIIDLYHRDFIEKVLGNFKMPIENTGKKESLSEYLELYSIQNKDDKQKESLKKLGENLRKQISSAFKKHKSYKNLDKKELIKDDLPKFLEDEKQKEIVAKFNDFTSYFTGFHENRQNMYSEEEKSTAIAYRLINDNLPKFIDNIRVFKQIKDELHDKIISVEENLKLELGELKLEDLFTINGFNSVLTQNNIDLYNAVIGGKSEDKEKIQGLNEYINLYNQRNNNKKLPKLKQLYKQILSDKGTLSWLPEAFDDDNEVLECVECCYRSIFNNVLTGEHSIKNILTTINSYDLDGIFIRNDNQLSEISQRFFHGWDIINNAIKADYRKNNPKGAKEKEEKYEEKCEKYLKSFDSFSIGYINRCLEASGFKCKLETYFFDFGKTYINDNNKDCFEIIEKCYTDVRDDLNINYSNKKPLNQNDSLIEKIKNLLDSIKAFLHFVKPLLGNGDEPVKDEKFYGEFIALYEELDKITPIYNKVRNYITKRPYSIEKFKLNFDAPKFLEGWDLNKENDYNGVILTKGENYYLAVLNKNKDQNRVFSGELPAEGDCYQKMYYKQIALPMGAGAFVRKCFNSAMSYGWVCPKECLNSEGKIIITNDEAKENLPQLIDCYKDFFEKYEKDGFKYKSFEFCFKNSKDYERLTDFFDDVKTQGYKISFKKVSTSYINQLVDEGKIYLFQIYNKDFSEYSKGTPNMHTLYWKMLFDDKNLEDVVYKLNGKAEVFFRKSSITYEKPTHPANEPIKNKNKSNPKKTSVFEYDLIKNKRYSVDKFLFHVPITMNFKANGKDYINNFVNEFIRNNGIKHIIGIDRGERHLLYLVVIDLHGNIVEQYSLNEIINNVGKDGKKYDCITNYHDLLDDRETKLLEARKSWKTIEGIKDLKEGYLSQVVCKIADLMIKYKAIVVLEKLNPGFMRGRQKVEKQVYQKFEQMLIDKLNYLVDKKASPDSVGGLLKAYQLTSKFNGFNELGIQSGFLFYIPAWNTSKMDPVTGFVNLFDTRYINAEKARAFFGSFDKIIYNKSKGVFEFYFDYNNFTTKALDTKSKWTVSTHDTRIETFRNKEKNSQWDSREINLSEKILQLFTEAGIYLNGNLIPSIVKQESKFLSELIYLFKLTLQMRNSITGSEIDYLISPIVEADGNYFDSRKAKGGLPQNADANGAYNIARKGLWVVKQIEESKPDDKKLKLSITNKEWLNFAQQKPYLK